MAKLTINSLFQTFKKFVQTGRVARCARGKYKGRLVCIVDIIDQTRVRIEIEERVRVIFTKVMILPSLGRADWYKNEATFRNWTPLSWHKIQKSRNVSHMCFSQFQVLIDGPTSGVPRQQYPVSHLFLTKFRVKFPFTAPTRLVKQALEKFNLKEKWTSTQWAERAKAKHAVSHTQSFFSTPSFFTRMILYQFYDRKVPSDTNMKLTLISENPPSQASNTLSPIFVTNNFLLYRSVWA